MDKFTELACEIVETFEVLLDEKNITIPCASGTDEVDRCANENSARLYGSEYWGLVDNVEYLLNAYGLAKNKEKTHTIKLRKIGRVE